jgi:hypothetical protein
LAYGQAGAVKMCLGLAGDMVKAYGLWRGRR